MASHKSRVVLRSACVVAAIVISVSVSQAQDSTDKGTALRVPHTTGPSAQRQPIPAMIAAAVEAFLADEKGPQSFQRDDQAVEDSV